MGRFLFVPPLLEGDVMANGKIEDYPEAARSIALNLREFCDETLPYPEMIADAARKASEDLTLTRQMAAAYARERNHYRARAATMRAIIQLFLNDLPANRDWLDPSVESEAREILKTTA